MGGAGGEKKSKREEARCGVVCEAERRRGDAKRQGEATRGAQRGRRRAEQRRGSTGVRNVKESAISPVFQIWNKWWI